MKRRAFGISSGAALAFPGLVWPLVGKAQPAGHVHRVGVLRPTLPDDPSRLFEALSAVGYQQGRNLDLVHRYADGAFSQLPTLARELVRWRPEVIVAVGAAATLAVQGATSTIPIVMFGNFDPVALGVVPSLARPGGNTTGLLISSEGTFAAKKLELLREAVPQGRRIAMLVPDDPGILRQVQEVQNVASSLGVELMVTEVKGGQYEAAFTTITAARPAALLVAAHTFFVTDRKKIIELAAQNRLPAMYEWSDQVREGGLMSYGASLHDLYQRIAAYVDRILKGARPGDLPVELPDRLELAINLKTAREIGLQLPQSLLSRASELIE